MPKKKTTAIAPRAKLIPIESAAPITSSRKDPEHSDAVVDDLSQFPSVFENKAGRYELIRIDGGQAYYSFTNRFDKTVDATMSVIMWRKMQERASA